MALAAKVSQLIGIFPQTSWASQARPSHKRPVSKLGSPLVPACVTQDILDTGVSRVVSLTKRTRSER